MINIKITKTNDNIDKISILGHSGYKESGSDIVCASVSSICITTVNAIIRIDSNAIEYDGKDGYLTVDIKKHTTVIDILIQNMIELLYELEEDYKKYIKIDE